MSVPTSVKTANCGSNTIKQPYRNCLIKLFMSDKEMKTLRVENNRYIFSKASIRVLEPTPACYSKCTGKSFSRDSAVEA